MSGDSTDEERDTSGRTRDDTADDGNSDRNGGDSTSGQTEDGDGSGQTGGSGQSNAKRKTTTAQKVVMAVSVVFTLSLIVYGGWQMATAEEAVTPNATVVGTQTMPGGDVAVTVQLTNPGDVGLVSTTVEANCSMPPPSVELTYVPASSTRRATLVCPSGTTAPNVSVTNWVTA